MDTLELKRLLAAVVTEMEEHNGEFPVQGVPPKSAALMSALVEEFTPLELAGLGAACNAAAAVLTAAREAVHRG